MGVCPECGMGWACREDFIDHLAGHGIDAWRIRQLLAEWDLRGQATGPHAPDKPCKCRAYGMRFECELRKHRATDK